MLSPGILGTLQGYLSACLRTQCNRTRLPCLGLGTAVCRQLSIQQQAPKAAITPDCVVLNFGAPACETIIHQDTLMLAGNRRLAYYYLVVCVSGPLGMTCHK
jgi:hypothetical protein